MQNRSTDLYYCEMINVLLCLTNRLRARFTFFCTLINNVNEYASPQCSEYCGLTGRSRVSLQQIVIIVMTRIVVDKSTDNAKPHFDMFFTTILTSKKMLFQGTS